MSKTERSAPLQLLPFLLLGIVFGITATKTEIISWYRIQEMFRFHSFHMYGVIISAVAVAALGIQLIKRARLRTVGGEEVVVPAPEAGGPRFWVGGLLFGLGWGLAGACPGPIFALIGNGVAGAFVLLLGAMLGAWVYALVRSRLPH